MPTPGIGDPYWYEWFVGLKYVIEMLNSDSGISCVIFQHCEYSTIDDVVVEYNDGVKQLCYQVKHEISTSAPNSLTFGKMLETKENKKSLFEALFSGWKKAQSIGMHSIKPILYSNRIIHNRRSTRSYNGKKYSAYPVDLFVSLIQQEILTDQNLAALNERNSDLAHQWNELCGAIANADVDDLISFIKVLSIECNQLSLNELEQSLIAALSHVFGCNSGIAIELFGKLLVGLRGWTTSTRSDARITKEDVYSVLGFEEDIDAAQHRLAAPYPFFESRQTFCKRLDKVLQTTQKKVVFISGNPGSGKTSIVSYLQSTTARFLLRYHTFKPISPEQRFYNADSGMCTPEKLWGTLLIQLRKRFRGRLAQCNVPLCNALVSVQDMRNHVLRLLGILAREAAQHNMRIFVCIDGIDHAARANASLSFLSTLPLPSEIPDGVCFVIVGQPTALYREQYPMWLSTSENVEQVTMPKLRAGDIEQLILAQASHFSNHAVDLANMIFEKTEGNNLSVVFAVEELKTRQTLSDAVDQIRSSRISADIQQYYNHIWTHMKIELSRIVNAITFPESIIACPILLMNGRVNVRILARALATYKMDESDWRMVFDRLYPLVIPTNTPGEYALFHNDFRVFLMGVISEYQPRYEDIALKLAQDLFQNAEGILTYITAIPLLECANKAYLIPQYFTPGFVINALAEGVSKQRLDEFAHLSYKAACDNQDMDGLCNTYLSIKTLYQHYCYFEYYSREYNCNDYPEISFADISEIRTLPIEKQNLDEFEKVLSLCRKLYASHLSNHQARAITLYQKWFGRITPLVFLPLCADVVSEEKAWELGTTEVGFFLQHWGSVTAELNQPVPQMKKISSRLEMSAIFIYGEQYFNHCISHRKYALAVAALTEGFVPISVFAEKLEMLYYGDVAKQFEHFLTQVPADAENDIWILLAQAIKATCDPAFMPDQNLLMPLQAIEHIYDEACFKAVLRAFLSGYTNRDIDDSDLITQALEQYSDIKGEDGRKEQFWLFMQASSLLGKYYWNTTPASEKLIAHVTWLLSARLTRKFDYSRARRFLLYTLLHSPVGESFCNEEWFIDALHTSLFKIDNLGMYYKTTILDYLKRHQRLDMIAEYIKELYGKNGCNISLVEDRTEMHTKFSPYGKLVDPQMILNFSNQLKWDVVGYSGHKEYAMYGPADCFSIICKSMPGKWKSLGSHLYRQSEIASRSNNQASFDIINELSKAAINCGLSDYWELRTWDEDFRLNVDQIYHLLFEFISNATTAPDLEVMWLLNCGIQSWYTQEGRNGVRRIFDACIAQSKKIDVDFVSIAKEVTPQWISIVTQQANQRDTSLEDNKTLQIKEANIKAEYLELSINEMLDFLPAVGELPNSIAYYNAALKRVLSDERDIKKNLASILSSLCNYLQSKEWTYGRYDTVIRNLLSALGNDAFWKFAKCIEFQLSDYNYQISSHNLQLLFKLAFTESIEKMESLFNAEIQTQMLWINGNRHIEIMPDSVNSTNRFPQPQSLPEMAMYILLEQIETKNARKIESAALALYLLGTRFTEIMEAIPAIWGSLSAIQEEFLLLIIARWAAEGRCSKDICDMLLAAYTACNELSHKYLMHSILLNLRIPGVETNALTYCADVEGYSIPYDSTPIQADYCEWFLSLLECYDNAIESVNRIRAYIFVNGEIEEYSKHHYAELGDFIIPVIKRELDAVLYTEEKSGAWESIPLLSRKSRLLPAEDPFLLTEMPRMVFEDDWFQSISDEYGQERTNELSDEQMAAIALGGVSEDEIILAACLWYPWKHKEGKRYYIHSNVSSILSPHRLNIDNWSVGNYGLLAYEDTTDAALSERLYFGGVSLFNRLGGIRRLHHGNCQFVPSAIWQEFFNCKPSTNSPYIWLSENRCEVLRFERIASPQREAMREDYIRQPLLFRWVCNLTWLKEVLNNMGLKIWWITNSEDYLQR